MACIETPAVGAGASQADIDLWVTTVNNLAQGASIDASGTRAKIVNANNEWAGGTFDKANNIPGGTALALTDGYLYLTAGATAGNDVDYSGGKFIIKLYGTADFQNNGGFGN